LGERRAKGAEWRNQVPFAAQAEWKPLANRADPVDVLIEQGKSRIQELLPVRRKAPATVNDGEIAVAWNEELHAAPLSAKRLLALWNALRGVEKRKKVGDRDALIDQLWSAIEMCVHRHRSGDPTSDRPQLVDTSKEILFRVGSRSAPSGTPHVWSFLVLFQLLA